MAAAVCGEKDDLSLAVIAVCSQRSRATLNVLQENN